jgi:hypothetical protein
MPRLLKNILLQTLLALCTLAAVEAALRVADLRYLRIDVPGNFVAAIFRHDPEIGWSPAPSQISTYSHARKVTVRNNGLGLRDIEFERGSKPVVLFIGDSFTWGFNVEAEERFTELLRERFPGHTIVNAGVAGYGTDQEFLLLRRIWDAVQPRIVVLEVHLSDRRDNIRNRQYDGYFKPYTVRAEGGRLEWRGQPVPNQRRDCFASNWLTRNLLLARLGCAVYVVVRHPLVLVPDLTEDLVGLIRDFVTERNAQLFVGLERGDAKLEAYMREQKIPYVSFDGAETYMPADNHWTPKGHQLVADRIAKMLTEAGAVTVAER